MRRSVVAAAVVIACLGIGAVVAYALSGIGTVVLALVGIGALILTIDSNRQTENAFKIAQRPYVSVGRKDGTIVDLSKSPPRIYFMNSGLSMATNFLPNIFIGKSWSDAHGTHYREPSGTDYVHMVRYRARAGNGFMGVNCGGPDIAAGGTHVEPDPQLSEAIEALKAGKLTGFWLVGSFEYCDEFGAYHCAPIRAGYEPSLNDFFPEGSTGDIGCPRSGRSEPNGDNIPLPRCPQPDEPATICNHPKR